MSDLLESPPAHTRKRHHWLPVLLLLPLLLLAGVYFYLTGNADRQLREAVAEADRSDPHWRLEDIEANRAAVPEGQNAAEWVRAAKRGLPGNWRPAWEVPLYGKAAPGAEEKRVALEQRFRQLEPQRQLDGEELAALRAELKKVAPALPSARKLADLPQGRSPPIAYSPDWIGTLLPYTQEARDVASLLEFDAELRAQDGDADGALASCRGVLNAGRSLGDEPTLISQLVRMGCRTAAVDRVERVLAQGEPSDAALLEVQRLLEKEEPEPLLLFGMRGERAGMDRFLEGLQTGKVKMGPMLAAVNGSRGSSPPLETAALMSSAVVESQRAAMLRRTNRLVEIAQLPPDQQEAQIKELRATLKNEPLLVRMLEPALEKVAQTYRRSRAQLRCAVTAVAAERYRRAKGHWPDRLEELVEAGYLGQVPDDLYESGPLRWRGLDDGAVVYSVGPDGQDNGGKLDRANPPAAGTDLGFRLWDVKHRRQPPAPPNPVAPADSK
jgi:hypothetical protein